MSDAVPRRGKGPPPESDLSQLIAHGPALRDAHGRYIGAAIMVFALAKARRGPVGIATAFTVISGIAYHLLMR
jgi:hypothetical protein